MKPVCDGKCRTSLEHDKAYLAGTCDNYCSWHTWRAQAYPPHFIKYFPCDKASTCPKEEME